MIDCFLLLVRLGTWGTCNPVGLGSRKEERHMKNRNYSPPPPTPPLLSEDEENPSKISMLRHENEGLSSLF